MSKRPGRLVALLLGVVGLVVAATVACVLIPPRQSGDVAVPRSAASPEDVVSAYLAALNAHDCETARALMTDDAQQEAALWCEDVASLRRVHVGDHVTETPDESGRSAPEEVVDVPVSFDLDWRLLHRDGSMEEGPTAWGYLLVRDAADSPWRIFSQGMG